MIGSLRGQRASSILAECVLACFVLAPPAIVQGDEWRYPVCEPRSAQDPARLNLIGTADAYGMLAPCNAEIILYIARHTEIRTLHGTAEYLGSDDAVIGFNDFVAVLRGPSGGQYEAAVALPSVGAACVTLRLALSVEECRDSAAEPIACPEIRIVDEPVFAAVQVSGDDVNVCIE